MRIALLSYRGNPRAGGQGVYVRHLARALTDLGHRVTVFAGQPYPEVSEGVELVEVPSLDLYRADDPFRTPRRSEFRDAIDVLEYATMCTAGFPEPLTFSLRVAGILVLRPGEFDIVHDNQCLGYGLLSVARRVPVVATIHHPISIDRRHEIEAADTWQRRLAMRRWYGFHRMQARVARRLRRVIAVSEAARADITREFHVPPDRIGVAPNGVDTDLFRPLPHIAGRRGLIACVASSQLPLKGLSYLIEAVAKLRTERDVRLVVIGAGGDGKAARAAVKRFGIEDAVRFEGRVDALRLVELYAQSEVAVVPSLYEGFSLPAAEAMACEVPVVATTGGALPEVVGEDGVCGSLVRPADAGALADAIAAWLDDPDRRRSAGSAGRRRVLERFTWLAAAGRTVDEYRRAIV